jgi:hypothetical protein
VLRGDSYSRTRPNFSNNYLNKGPGSRSNSRGYGKPQISSSGYDVNKIKPVFGGGSSNRIKEDIPNSTNFIQRNKAALKKSFGGSSKGSSRPSNAERSSSIQSREPRENLKMQEANNRTPGKSNRSALKVREKSPQITPGYKPNNYLGRRGGDRSMSRDSSRDRSHNRSMNKSLNDSIEERRKRVLGGTVTRTLNNGRVENILPDLGLGNSGQKLFGRNFIEENKLKMLEAKTKKAGLLVGPNAKTPNANQVRHSRKDTPKESANNTSCSVINLADETRIEPKEPKNIDERLSNLQEMLAQAKQGLSEK